MKLNIYAVDDWCWVCAYTPEGAERAYRDYMGLSEEEYKDMVEDEGVYPTDSFELLSEREVNEFIYVREDGSKVTFAEELATRSGEEFFATTEF